MELQLVSLDHFHHHDLVFNENLSYNADGREILCRACLEPAEPKGAIYNCIECYFFLHKTCADLPSEIKHPLHRKHSLVLLPNSPYPGYRYGCNFCGIWSSKNYVYHCSTCGYDLHFKCAKKARCFIQPESQNHHFTRLIRSDPFICHFCSGYTVQWMPNELVDLDHSPYSCTECHIVVHRKCIPLSNSHTINIQQHDHSLTHTYFIPENESVDMNCRICSKEVNREFGSYCCRECPFVCHVNCTLVNNLDGSNSVPVDNLEEQLMISCLRIEEDFKLGEDILVQEIDHCSHEHRLTLGLHHEVKDTTYCDGCIQPISAPFYRCEQCDFNLHKTCSELPPKINHPLHQGHPLTLFSKPVGIDKCFACSRFWHGFRYVCIICEKPPMYDVRCALVNPLKFKHDGHEHPLTLTFKTNTDGGKCSACGTTHSYYFLQCNVCSFSLDYKCATLPRTVKHRFDDKHPFELTYVTVDDGSNEYYCDICEKERDQLHWYYYCAKCDYAAHPYCALGVHPFIKGGRRYGRRSVHHHDLFYERRTKDWLPCSSCGMRCCDLSLVCHELDCNFRLHWICRFSPEENYPYYPIEDEIDAPHLEEQLMISRPRIEGDEIDAPHLEEQLMISRPRIEEDEIDAPHLEEQLMISRLRIEEEFKLGEDILFQEIDHCSHEHRLTLGLDHEVKDNTYCDGCIQPISSPFYRCEKCDFNLHKVCTELPLEINHPLHQRHPLSLFSKPDGPYRCVACSRFCHGFRYVCIICEKPPMYDVRCALVNTFEFKHDGHEHPLTFTFKSYNDPGKCSACGVTNPDFLLQCNVCTFILDYRCATLPRTVKHRYDDKHPFELKYITVDDGSNEYYCDICEEERDQLHWYYHCAKCDYAAHPDCALGVHPFIKGGRLCERLSDHHHDLYFERRTKDWLPCSLCGKRCCDLSIVCHELDCNFRLHWNCCI